MTLRAQVPAEDSRNTYVPNTDTDLTTPVYRTLAKWEARRAHLRPGDQGACFGGHHLIKDSGTEGCCRPGQPDPGGANRVLSPAPGVPCFAATDAQYTLFKLEKDGSHATRVVVRFGAASVHAIQILKGLQAGDRVIISDMSKYDGYDRIRVE